MPKIVKGKDAVAKFLKDREVNHGPLSFTYITPAEAKEKGDTRSLQELVALSRQKARTCCNCDNPVWKYGGGDMCFPCTTGESDASSDYELK